MHAIRKSRWLTCTHSHTQVLNESLSEAAATAATATYPFVGGGTRRL